MSAEAILNPFARFRGFMSKKKPKKKTKGDKSATENKLSKFFGSISGKDKLVNQRVTVTEGAVVVNKAPLKMSFGAATDKEFFANQEHLKKLETLDKFGDTFSVVENAVKDNTEAVQASIGVQRSTFSMWANYIKWLKNQEALQERDSKEEVTDRKNWRTRLLAFFNDKFNSVDDKRSSNGGGLLGSLLGGASLLFRGGALKSLAKLFTGKGLLGLAKGALKRVKGFFSLKGLKSTGLSIGKFFKNVVGGIWGGLKSIFSLKGLKTAGKGGLGKFFTNIVSGIWGTLKKLFSLKSLKSFGGLGRFLVSGLWSILSRVLMLVVRGVAVAVGGIPAAIITLIVGAAWAIWEYLVPDETKDKIIQALSEAWDKALAWIKDGIKWLGSAFDTLFNNWDSVVNSVVDFGKRLVSFSSSILDQGQQLLNKFVGAIEHVWGFINYIPEWVGQKVDSIKSKVSSAFDSFTSYVGNIVDWITGLPERVWNWITDTVKNSPMGKMVGMAMDGWSMIKDKVVGKEETVVDRKVQETIVKKQLETAVNQDPAVANGLVQALRKFGSKTDAEVRVTERLDEMSGRSTMHAAPVTKTVSGPKTYSATAKHDAVGSSQATTGLERARLVSMNPVVKVEQVQQVPQQPFVIGGGGNQPTMNSVPVIVEDTGLMLINMGVH